MAYSDLTSAASAGSIEKVESILAQGVDINEQDPDGDTALMIAARNQHLKLTQWLVERGADIHLRDNSGFSPLTWAQAHAPRGFMKLLLETQPQELAARRLLEEKWIMQGSQEIACVKNCPALRLSLTNIFNFKTRERVTMTRDLETNSLSGGVPQSFDAASEDIVREAFNQFKKMGGEADAEFVFFRRTALEGKLRLPGK